MRNPPTYQHCTYLLYNHVKYRHQLFWSLKNLCMTYIWHWQLMSLCITTNWFTVWRQEKAYKTKVFLKRFPTIINNFDRMAEWISHWLCSQAIAWSNPTKGYFFFLNFQNWLYYKIFSSLAPQGLTYFWPT